MRFHVIVTPTVTSTPEAITFVFSLVHRVYLGYGCEGFET